MLTAITPSLPQFYRYTPAITIGATMCKVNRPTGTGDNCTAPTATVSDLSNTNALSTLGKQRIVLSGMNVGNTRVDPLTGNSVLELEEIRMGPSPTTSRILPLIYPVPADWYATNDTPGCVLNVR